MPRTKLGFVAAGKRARTLMEHAYTIRDRSYLESDPVEGYDYPHDLYEQFGDTEEQEWMTDVSDLEPAVTAIMSPSEDSRREAAELCGGRGDDPNLFASFEAFLEEGTFDCAMVCSPNDAHVDAVVPLLERDVHTFCEKPLAATLEGHDRIREAADQSTGTFYPGFQRRSDPRSRTVKSLLDDGAIGRLGMIHHTETRDPFHIASPGEKGYRYDQDRSGGSILEKNCHEFDVFNWFAESDPTHVSAFGGQHVFSRNTDVLDQATINVQYDNGVVASLDLCLYAGTGPEDIYGVRVQNTSELRGSTGVLSLPNDGGIEIERREGRQRRDRGVEDASFDGHGGDLHQMRRLLRCIDGDASPPMTVQEAKTAAAIAIGAERSVRNDGQAYRIDEQSDLVAGPTGRT
jgi:predicted dehydrogenase